MPNVMATNIVTNLYLLHDKNQSACIMKYRP